MENTSKPKEERLALKGHFLPSTGRSALKGLGHSNDQMLVLKYFAVTHEITRVFLLLPLLVFILLFLTSSGVLLFSLMREKITFKSEPKAPFSAKTNKQKTPTTISVGCRKTTTKNTYTPNISLV